MKFKINPSGRTVSFPKDSIHIEEESLLAAAQVFSDQAEVWVDEVNIELEAKAEPCDSAALEQLARDFREELAAQELRRRIAVENRTVREYLIVSALMAAFGERNGAAKKDPSPSTPKKMSDLMRKAESELDPKALLKAFNDDGG